MSSPLLALFARSLREDVRTQMTYFARAALVLVILFFVLSEQAAYGWGNAPGLRFFETVVYINLFFILLAGLSYFASAITEEKEEMTLGLLRMTNLDPLSILLGKSTSRLVGALLLLAAQFPFTLLAVALGGVALPQIVAAYCTLGAFLILLANVALLASVICQRTPAAATLTGLTLLAIFGLVPALRWILTSMLASSFVQKPVALLAVLVPAAELVALASPLHRLNQILRTGFAESPVGAQVWSNLALGAGCFVLAWLLFEFFCGDQREAAPRRSVRRSRGRLRFGAPGRPWRRALAWKDFHFLAGGKVWMLVKFAFYALPLTAVALISRPLGGMQVHHFGYFTVWLMFLIACAELAFMAGSIFQQERNWKTLSSLAMLPMPLHRVAYQKILGGFPALIPAAFYWTIGLVCLGDKLANAWRDFVGGDEVLYGTSYGFVLGVLFLHTVSWLSLYLKRGALPLAIAIHLILQTFLSISMLPGVSEEAAFLVLALLFAGVTVVLHVKIGQRLEALAAED